MLSCIIGYMPGEGRRDLATALIKDLPTMLQTVLEIAAGTVLTSDQMTIDIAAWDSDAYNKPSMEVVVTPDGDEGDYTYDSRRKVRRFLKEYLHEWLCKHPELRDAAELDTFGVSLHFIEMCGTTVDVTTGFSRSSWGAPGDASEYRD